MAKSVKAFITPEVLKWARERRIRLEIDYAAKRLKIETEFLEFNKAQLQQANDPYAALAFWKQTIKAKGILACHTSVNTHLSVEKASTRSASVYTVDATACKDGP